MRKDVEDERRAVEDFDLKNLFQIARLRGGKLVVEDDRVHVLLAAEPCELARFALADVGGGIEGFDFLRALADDLAAGGLGQFTKFVQRLAQVCRGADLSSVRRGRPVPSGCFGLRLRLSFSSVVRPEYG